MTVRALELFSGIGGCAFALGDRADIVLAVDQDDAARATYARQHPGTPMSPYNLHAANVAWFSKVEADLWWMSPPCQPYTIRGHQRDLADRRSAAFVRVVDAIRALRPDAVALENVPWFAGSQGEALLLRALDEGGYDVATEILCPSSLGVPAERRRYYLVASRSGLGPPRAEPPPNLRPSDFLLAEPDPSLDVPSDLAARYDGALHIVDAEDPAGVFACFTGAYGRSPVHAGSYVRDRGRLRRLDPAEIAATLGHPRFDPPPELPQHKRYKLVGNSLSVPAVRRVLSRLPTLGPHPAPPASPRRPA
jgi:DNA (cytosine-5)-methyltransferase 1